MHAARVMDDFRPEVDVDLVGSVTAYVKQEVTNAAVTIRTTTSCEPADSRVEPSLTELALLRDRARGMCKMMLAVVSTLDGATGTEPTDPSCAFVSSLESVVDLNRDYGETLEEAVSKVHLISDVNGATKQCLEAGIMDVIEALSKLAGSARKLIRAIELHDQRVRRNTGKSAASIASVAMVAGSAGVSKYEAIRGLRTNDAFNRKGALERIRMTRVR